MNGSDSDKESFRAYSAEEIEFRRETIYFIVVDRFNNGNPSNLRGNPELNDPSHRDWDKYWGGDLQGILDKLDYLQEMGVTAIWLTPLFEQVEALEEGGQRAPMHGYWARDFKRINSRWLNDPDESSLFRCKHTLFDKLLSALHERGMKFVLDIVCNHSSPTTSDGKGKLFDDGKLVADHENDVDHWYHHYGEVTDWEDEWQIQNKDVGGLATFNENNILYRRYIKEAIKLWLSRGVDALRIDTVKHMPLWFWQEFVTDMQTFKPNVFVFAEWINSHPDNKTAMQYANEDGMNLLDFGVCQAIRDCIAERKGRGFHLIQDVLNKDGNYKRASELVTLIENHDMPRFQSLNPDPKALHLALILLQTIRGIPCIYYGCEQYLYSNRGGGEDPYNRPMMCTWGQTEACRIIALLSEERRMNPAIQWGGVWHKRVKNDVYVFLRRYRQSRCLVAVNRGKPTKFNVNDLEMPDGEYHCVLTDRRIVVKNGAAKFRLNQMDALVFTIRSKACNAKSPIHVQVNGVSIQQGERIAVTGDCPELGEWDLQHMQYLECVNENTWFGELCFDHSCGRSIAYKYVVLKGDSLAGARREMREPRRRNIPESGVAKWQDNWQQ